MWARAVSALAGLWLEVAPAVIGYGGAARRVDRIIAPLIIACALIAWSEVTRSVRWVNLALGVVLVVSAWPLGYPAAGGLSAAAVGLVVAACATVRGPIRQRYGGGWSALLRKTDG